MPNMKKIISTRGLVLRTVSYSDSSQIVTVFTKDQGVVTLLAKGSLRLSLKSSSFPAPFDRCGWYDIVFRRGGGDLHLATEGKLVEGFDRLRRNLAAYLDTCLALEVMSKTFSAEDPHPVFLHGALSYLKLLEKNTADRPRRALRVHLYGHLLAELGWAPQWESCLDCGRALGANFVVLVPTGVRCHECSRGRGQRVSEAVVRYLVLEQQAPWRSVPALRPGDHVLTGAWHLLVTTLLHHLDRPPRSLRYLPHGGAAAPTGREPRS